MAVQTLPVNIDLTIYSGTTFRRQFKWKPAGVGQDFTGWTAELRVGPPRGAAVHVLTDTAGVTLDNLGNVFLFIDAEDTETMAPGTWRYTLDLTDTLGQVIRLLRGRLSVVRDMEA